MSRRVYGWDQNPITDKHPYRCSNSSAEYAILHGFAIEIIDGDGRPGIHLIQPTEVEDVSAETSIGLVSAKVILQFIRTHCQGSRLNYEIPRAGDRGMRRYGLFTRRDEQGRVQLRSHVIRVSSRNLFATQAQPRFVEIAR